MRRRFMRFPVGTLLRLSGELRNGFKLQMLRISAIVDGCHGVIVDGVSA
jgi:hypothetical protein